MSLINPGRISLNQEQWVIRTCSISAKTKSSYLCISLEIDYTKTFDSFQRFCQMPVHALACFWKNGIIEVLVKYLEKLVDALDIKQPLAPNEDGSYSLDIEPNLHILLRENPGSVISLYTVLAGLPEKNQEEFLLMTMTANLFGRETGGSALGLDHEAKNVTLLNFLPEDVSYHEFHSFLEEFVNYADAWKQEITELRE